MVCFVINKTISCQKNKKKSTFFPFKEINTFFENRMKKNGHQNIACMNLKIVICVITDFLPSITFNKPRKFSNE